MTLDELVTLKRSRALDHVVVDEKLERLYVYRKYRRRTVLAGSFDYFDEDFPRALRICGVRL